MQLAVDVTLPNILNLISNMSLKEIEDVKNTILEKLYQILKKKITQMIF